MTKVAVKKKIKRHGLSVIFVHWAVAISTFVLIFSGFGQMPLYKRYMVDHLPLAVLGYQLFSDAVHPLLGGGCAYICHSVSRRFPWYTQGL